MRGRILPYEVLLFRFFKCGSAMRMNASDHRVFQPCAVLLSPYESAIAFEMCVELLERAGRDLIERNITDLRDDLIVYPLLLCGLRVLLQRRLAIGLIPEVHPLAEWHVRGASRDLSCADFFLECFEAFHTLCFGFSKDALGFRQAPIIVSDDDSSFPSAVLA